jgi:hypothetical protein
MEKDRSAQEQFIEYLDRLLAGEEVTIGDDVSEDMRSTLEFARTMLASRDEPSYAFRTRLRERLLHKLVEEEARSTGLSMKKGFRERMRGFFPQSVMWRTVASTAVVVLLAVIVGTFWYSGRQIAPQSMAPSPELPKGEYSVDLPANIIPSSVSVKVDTSLSDRRGEAVVYRVEAPDVTVEAVETLGRRFGFSGDAVVTGDGTQIVMYEGEGSEAKELVVWPVSGAFEYGFTELDKLYPAEPSGLPSEKEAKRIAYHFLEQVDLLPTEYSRLSHFEDETVLIAGGSYGITKGTGEETAQKAPSYWIVSIPYSIDGVWTTGPGSEIEVRIGAGGEVVRLIWPWRNVYSVSTETILSEEEALHELLLGKGGVELPGNCTDIIVKDVALTYWINAPSEGQDYALPVYRFTGTCLDISGETIEDFTGWTKALPDNY